MAIQLGPEEETKAEKELRVKFQDHQKLNLAEQALHLKPKLIETKDGLEASKQRLTNLVEEFNNKQALGVTPDELQDLGMKITIAKSIYEQQKRKARKEARRNGEQVTEGSDNESHNGSHLALKAKNASKKMAADIFEAKEQFAVGQFELLESHPSKKSFDDDEFDMVMHGDEPYVMEVNLDFRAQLTRDQKRRVFEIQETLDKCTVSDFISYKLKEDKASNFITFDDLRWKHVQVAAQLQELLGAKKTTEDTTNAIEAYKKLIQGPKGDLGMPSRNRTLDESSQQNVNTTLNNFETRHVKPKNAVRFRLEKFLSKDMKEQQPETTTGSAVPTFTLANTQITTLAAKPEENRLQSSIRTSLESKMKLLGRSSVKSKVSESLRQSLTRKVQNGLQTESKLDSNKASWFLKSQEKTSQKPPEKKQSLQVAGLMSKLMGQDSAIKKAFEELIKKRIFEAEVDKCPRGFVRLRSFDMEMSEVALNFGLKLYNLQNVNDVNEMLRLTKTPRLVPEGLEVHVRQKKTIWSKTAFQESLEQMAAQIDWGFDHTEFELLERLYGKEEACMVMLQRLKASNPEQRLREMRQLQDEQNWAIELKKRQPPPPQASYFEYNSMDFYEDGTYKNSRAKQGFNVLAKALKHKVEVKRRSMTNWFAKNPQKNYSPSVSAMESLIMRQQETDQSKELPELLKVIGETQVTNGNETVDLLFKRQKLDFVRLNKVIVYPHQQRLNSLTPDQRSSEDEVITTAKPKRRVPLSVRANERRNLSFQSKILRTEEDLDARTRIETASRCLAPGQQNKLLPVSEQLQQLQKARNNLRQFNSIDEQLKLSSFKIQDFSIVDSFEQFLKDQQKRVSIEEWPLTKVYVQGHRHKARKYIAKLPYAKRIDTRNTKRDKLLHTQQNSPKHTRVFSEGDVSINQSDYFTQRLKTSPLGGRNQKQSFDLQSAQPRTAFQERRQTSDLPTVYSIRSNDTLDAVPEVVKTQTEESIEIKSESDQWSEIETNMTEAELLAANIQLREEVETKVFVFEQYLKVAMLQTSIDHYQKKAVEDQSDANQSQRLDSNSSRLNSLASLHGEVVETFEVKEDINDPTLAYTIAAYDKNTHESKFAAKRSANLNSKKAKRSGQANDETLHAGRRQSLPKSSKEAMQDEGQHKGNNLTVPAIYNENRLGKIDTEIARGLKIGQKQDARENFRIKNEQAQRLNFLLGEQQLNSDWERLLSVPRHYRGMTGFESYQNLIGNKRLLAPQLVTLDMPFTRLEAKPEAIKSHLKSLIANPFLVSKKGRRPYIELEDPTHINTFPLEKHSKRRHKHQMRRLIKKTLKQGDFHAAHVEWLERIQQLWLKLDSNDNYRRFKEDSDKLLENERRLQQLRQENYYEFKVTKKKVTVSKSRERKQKRKLLTKAEQLALKAAFKTRSEEVSSVNDRLREAKNHQADLQNLRLHRDVIRLKLDCRLHEHIIYQAQQLHLKPDIRMERELEELRDKGAKMSEDIFSFLADRDQIIWREWCEGSDPRILEIIRAYYRREVLGNEPSHEELDGLILKLIDETNMIEDRLDLVEIDGQMHSQINKMMKGLFSQAFTHQVWTIWENKRKLELVRSARKVFEMLTDETRVKGQPTQTKVKQSTEQLDLNSEQSPRSKNPPDNENSPRLEKTPLPQIQIGEFNEEQEPEMSHVFTAAKRQAVIMKTSAKKKKAEHSFGDFANGLEQFDAVSLVQKTDSKNESPASGGSKWLSALKQEQRRKNEIARTVELLIPSWEDSSSEDEAILRILDAQAADRNIKDKFGAINAHLQAQQKLMTDWSIADKMEEQQSNKVNNELMQKVKRSK